jgi:hypothetical protein
MRFFIPKFFSLIDRMDSMAKNMPKIAGVKLSTCGLKVADFRKNCDCGIVMRSNVFSLKSCRIAIAEVLP